MIKISTILSLTPVATSQIICNMPTTLLLDPSGDTYVPFRNLEGAVVLPNIPKYCCSYTDRMGVNFVILNLSDNAFCSTTSRRYFSSSLWYMLLWNISTALTLPPLWFCRAFPMLPHVFLKISLSMRLLIYFSLLILPLATSSFTLRANNLAL